MLKEYSLEDRVALVTGASSGIGKEMAVVLAEAGADVVVAARRRERLEETAAAVRALGRRCHLVQADVTQEADVRRMAKEALRAFGQVDILVNNAGISIRGPVVDREGVPIIGKVPPQLSLVSWNQVMATNLTGAFLACQAVAPHMLERRRGKVINVSSIDGVRAEPGNSVYAASKAALNHFTRVLALEWAPFNVCVNALAPGAFWTEMWELNVPRPDIWDRLQQRVAEGIPLRRWGDLRDLGLLAVYLASDASNYLTGQVLTLDGGATAQ